MKHLWIFLLIISCQSEIEKRAEENDRKIEQIEKNLERELRLIEAGYSQHDVDSIMKKIK